MISPTAYILISTILSQGKITQTTASFADKPSCESAAVRQDFVLKSLDMTMGRWNFTCHPYALSGEKK
jgi:hypothetical protein